MTKKRLEFNLKNVQSRIRSAAERSGRKPDDVTLVVVTKGRSIEDIKTLYDLGVRDFGENRVEQAKVKIEELSELKDIRWHMIGHVQSRKAKDVINLFDFLHSLDRLKLAHSLDRFAKDKNKALPVLLQINVSGEETKSGWGVSQKTGFESFKRDVEVFFQLSDLKVNGLMTMAPFAPDPEASRIYFRRLSEVRDQLKDQFPNLELRTLSMGMSGDFEVAVEEGATMVRVGSAVFDY